MDLAGLSSVKPVAKFLGSPEDEVVQLVKEGKLGGAMVNALGRRGVSVTPSIKNSVGAVVRSLEAEYCGAAPNGHEPDSTQATATIMFTDIVGSTPVMVRMGDRRARVMFRIHDDIIRRQTAAYGGQEIKSTGDGFMMTFRSARSGVACAVAVQKELNRYNDDHPDSQMTVRIGLSVGEPLREDEDLFGSSVARAARISAAAVGGQVLVCQIVQALVAGTGDFDMRDAGQFELKGISGTHMLSEVIWRQQ